MRNGTTWHNTSITRRGHRKVNQAARNKPKHNSESEFEPKLINTATF
ncbi:unnamed protein product [Brugia timori]|uniref:Uncharacterized protein n=1 Tax=Brugia timori TaxID=42155 RepID=A0A0R3QHY9_9BILA|nr:unnamed protein product [Brugia timori]